MSKLFCLSPGLRVLERQMQQPPGYRPRGYGICIIEEMEWKRREQVRIEGSRGKHRPNKRERLIFSGVLICAECGCPYSHIQPSHKKERYGVPKWKCKNYVY